MNEQAMLKKAESYLNENKWLRHCEFNNAEITYLKKFLFFTSKPVVYLANISTKNQVNKKNSYLPKMAKWIKENCPGQLLPFSVSYEQALEKGDLKGESLLIKIIHTGYKILNLIHFFTCGRDEVRCWTVRKGTKAPQAAGVIHSDFEKGFICAEVMNYKDLKELGSEQKVKASGKYKMQGKDYIVKDGDIIFFKFSKGKK